MDIYWQNTADQDKAKRLIEQGLLDEETLKKLILERQEKLQNAHARLKGQLYQLDEEHAICSVKDSISLSTLRKLELVSEYELFPGTQSLGQDILLLHPQHPEIIDTHRFQAPQTLLNTKSGTYIYSPDFAQETHIAQSNVFYYPYLPELSQNHGPFDLVFSSQGKHLCISDRKEGSVFFLKTLDYELIETYQLRAEGSPHPLFMVLDDNDEQVYYIDGQTPHIYVLDLYSGALEQYLLEEEIPGHLLLHPTERQLYLLLKSPAPKLKLLDLETLETQAEYELPSSFDVQRETHLHQLLVAPEGNYLSLLTYKHSQPILMHFSADTLSPLGIEPLPAASDPFLITHGHPNPLKANMSLKDILLEAGAITEEQWDALSLPTDTTEQQVDEPAPKAPEQKQPTQDTPGLPSAAKIFLSALAKPQSWSQPRPDDTIFLPSESMEDILHILTGTFYQQTGIDLGEHPDDLQRFWQLAKKARLHLQDFDSFQAHLPEVLGTHDFKTMVYRSSIQTIAQLREAENRSYDTPPTHCPSCHHPLLGSWDCSSCGLELENSIRHRKRKTASWDYSHWLPPDYFALPDMQQGRLLLLNSRSFQYVAWELNLRSLPFCLEPSDILWLDHLHVLVTDAKTHEVFEINSAGQIRYRYQPRTEHAQLLYPVKTTIRIDSDGHKRYLIVDKGNHRILEVDAEHGVQWEYGKKGEADGRPGYLNSPNDVQFTHEGSYLITDTDNHRVIEVIGNKVHKTFGKDELKHPVYAQRLFDGKTVVADHNGKLTIFDADGHIQEQITFFNSKMPQNIQVPYPIKVIRRPQRTYVLLDQEQIIEIEPQTHRIKWSHRFDHLQLKLGHRVEHPDDEELRRPLALAFDDYGPPEPPHIITLRQMLKDISLFEDAPESFYVEIEKGLRTRSFKAGEMVIQKGKLSRSMFFILRGELEILGDNQQDAVLLLQAGDSFGYMSLVFSEPRKSTIRCTQDCSLVVLDKKHFDEVIAHYPKVTEKVKALAAERLVISRLKKAPKQLASSEKLKALIAKHKAQLSQMARRPNPSKTIETIDPHYTAEEQSAIQQSQTPVYEVDLLFYEKYRMRSARLYLVTQVLDHLGTLYKATPDPEGLEEEALGRHFVFTLGTALKTAQIIEDLTAIAEVEQVKVELIYAPAK